MSIGLPASKSDLGDASEKHRPESSVADPKEVTAIPLLEEELAVSKREVVTGRVRVRTVVDTREELVRQELETEHVSVTRVPIDRYVDAAPSVRTEGNVTIVPVLEEVLVIETRLLLKEEVHILRTVSTETVEQSVRLRQQRAIVEKSGEK